ncbi:helix-turn-helix domain-containing protein [Gracilibacillus sp. YIM 98692]|uniref:IclR family transcriptional regulator n=1 Tax=Gracilibacillus sp. YIM 98692 TaxID=2663532 RepID=UPI0013CFDD10|nr:helix-turn-helix domain-containing protein [Gracilibacillus sp. YIM 98692]
MANKKSKDTIQSLKIGFSIIDALMEEKRPLKITEIQEKTNVTKSNLYKYINTLLLDDLIFRDEHSGLYYLGSKLIQYGMTAIGNQDIFAMITPYLHSISEYTNNSTIFAVPTFNGPVIANMTRSNQILNIGAEIGTLLPPNSSAGKIFYVFGDSQKTKHWRESDDPSIISDENEIQLIHKEKIAFAKEPLIPSVSSVSIPVLNYANELIGILTVVGFSSFVPETVEDSLSKYLQKIQNEISMSDYN